MTVAKSGYHEVNIEESLESSESMISLLDDLWQQKQLDDLSKKLINLNAEIMSKDRAQKTQILFFFSKAKLIPELEEILTSLHETGVFKTSESWALAKSIYQVLWNFAYCSDRISYSLCESKIIKIIQDNLRSSQYRDEMSVYDTVRLLINCSLSIVGNILQFPNTLQYFDSDIAEVIAYFSQLNDLEIKLTASLALPYALSDESIAKLNYQGIDLVKQIFKCLDSLVEESKKENVSGTIVVGSGSFASEEFLASISKLCINASIQKTIVEENSVQTLTKYLSSQESGEVKAAISCLHRLAFNHDIRKDLQSWRSILNKLEYLSSTHSDSEVKKVAADALWFIGDKESEIKEVKISKAQSSPSCQYDLFISYAHANKEKVIKMYDKLKGSYKIWIDKDCLHGEMLKEIPKGISDSKIFVLCMSSKYCESDTCDREMQYAWKKKKLIIPVRVEEEYQADDCLEFIISNKMYYDLSEGKYFEKEFKKLLVDISKKLDS